jgi:hypothetical protein
VCQIGLESEGFWHSDSFEDIEHISQECIPAQQISPSAASR